MTEFGRCRTGEASQGRRPPPAQPRRDPLKPRTLVALLAAALAASVVPAGAAAQASSAELSRAPTFTPMTVRPEILNAAEITTALAAAYPPMLRDAGIGGTVSVALFIDETGRVGNKVVQRSSGYAPLDQAALEVVEVYRFRPAMNRDQVVPVWVTFPVTFRLAPASSGRGAAAAGDLSREPTFTPMTVRPEILNAAEIVLEMQRGYPPILRQAGIGGTVQVSFFVDENGAVGNALLERSSGHPALDEAALRIARLYRFSPAQNRETVVPVWITLPMTFRMGPG